MGLFSSVAKAVGGVIGGVGTLLTGVLGYKEADRQADEIERREKQERKRLEREAETLKGRQRAAYAASGVRVDQDTPLAVLQETERIYEEEIDETGKRADYAADTARREGRNLLISSMFGAGGTLLGGAADVYTAGRKGGLWK